MKRFLRVKVHESIRDEPATCEIYDEEDNHLGTLPASKVTAVVSWTNRAVVTIEIFGETVDIETLNPHYTGRSSHDSDSQRDSRFDSPSGSDPSTDA